MTETLSTLPPWAWILVTLAVFGLALGGFLIFGRRKDKPPAEPKG